MARVLRSLISRIAPLRRARACDPYANCAECDYSCGSCLGVFYNKGCCLGGCVCC